MDTRRDNGLSFGLMWTAIRLKVAGPDVESEPSKSAEVNNHIQS